MVAVTHMSNVLGTVVPIKEVVRIAHARGIPVLVDGARPRCICPVDVQDLDSTSTPSPATRPTGPPVSACSTPRGSTSTRCRPTRAAATMIESVNIEASRTAGPPHKFEAGTPPIVQAIG